MAEIDTVSKADQNLDLESFPSLTFAFQVGCGKLFITVIHHEGQIIKVITHRKSVFLCDLTFFDALNRQTSFVTNRELEQAIEDLKGFEGVPHASHYCQNYNVTVKSALKNGRLGAYSCSDAVARALEKAIDEISG